MNLIEEDMNREYTRKENRMQNYEQIRAIIKMIQLIIEAMRKGRLGEIDIQNLQLTVEEVNFILYHVRRLRFQRDYDLSNEQEYLDFVEELESLIIIWNQSMERRIGKSVDVEFWDTYEFFGYANLDDIYQMVVEYFMKLPEGLRIEFLALPHRYLFLKNKIDYTKNDFSLIAEYIEMMANNVDKYKWLYEHLADYRSKVILNGIIRYWFRFDAGNLHALCEGAFSDYYDLDILKCDENTVFVDLGAYNGDSVRDFINTYGVYKKVYAYELTPATYQVLLQNLADYSNIVPIQKGISAKPGIMYVNNVANKAGNCILDSGDTAVEITTLDEDIKETISVIKMDIEGAEKDALMGAERHIKQEKPKMLISSYYLSEDIFEIPYMIQSMRDDYKFYMRFNGHNGLWPCDYVLFAV